MAEVWATCFWGALALVAYAYGIYPPLMLRIARKIKLSRTKAPATPDLPSVTVIISAYNEERHIGARIQNLLQQDYPADRINIVIGSDGSSDRTVEIAREFSDPRIKLLEIGRAHV